MPTLNSEEKAGSMARPAILVGATGRTVTGFRGFLGIRDPVMNPAIPCE
jgi:hypothetical protein